MALAHREATVTWHGTLGGGDGALRIAGEDRRLPVDWAARSSDAGGTTSPEELLAAAHAGCFAMVLALALTRNGTPAEELEVHGACELDHGHDGREHAITALRVDVRGVVPGLDAERFEALARQADADCPVANAVRPTVPTELGVRLQPASPGEPEAAPR